VRPLRALVAQLDRASDFESEGREFESLRARHLGIEHCLTDGNARRSCNRPHDVFAISEHLKLLQQQ
jgi:hypothetical protein